MTSNVILRLIPLLVIAALTVAACNGDDDAAEQSPEQIVQDTASAFAETESARFSLEIEGAISIDAEGMLALGSVEGELERPANARVDAGILFAGTSVTMELVAVDGEMFLRNILTGNWERAPSDLRYDPALVFDETRGVTHVLGQLSDLEHLGSETVRGDQASHVRGNVPTTEVTALTGDFFEADTLVIDLWVDRDTNELLRVELRESVDQDDADWRLDLFDHDEPVTIERPEVN